MKKKKDGSSKNQRKDKNGVPPDSVTPSGSSATSTTPSKTSLEERKTSSPQPLFYNSGEGNKNLYATKVTNSRQSPQEENVGVQSAFEPVRPSVNPTRLNSGLPNEPVACVRTIPGQSRNIGAVNPGRFHGGPNYMSQFSPPPFAVMIVQPFGMPNMPGPAFMQGPNYMYGMGTLYGMGGMYGMGSVNPSFTPFPHPTSFQTSNFGSMYSMGSVPSLGGSIQGLGGSMYGMGPHTRFSFVSQPEAGLRSGSEDKGQRANYEAMNPSSLFNFSFNGDSGGDHSYIEQESPPMSPSFPDQPEPVAKSSGNTNQAVTPQKDSKKKEDSAQTPTSASGGGGNARERIPKGEPIEVVVLVEKKTTKDSTTIVADAESGKVSFNKKEIPVNQVFLCDPGSETQLLGSSSSFGSVVQHTTAGHNTAIIFASGCSAAEVKMTSTCAEGCIMDSLKLVHKHCQENEGSFNAQLFCCAFKDSKTAKDLVNGGSFKAVEIGSHPIFGQGFCDIKPYDIKKDLSKEDALRKTLQNCLSTTSRKDSAVIVVQVVIKQTRKSSEGQTDVFLSSLKILVSCVTQGSSAFFEAIQDEKLTPTRFSKSCLGGSCYTMCVLCVSPSTSSAEATLAGKSVEWVQGVVNLPPRSGSVTRFLNFASGEYEKRAQRQKPGKESYAVKKLYVMVNDAKALLGDPSGPIPVAYKTDSRPSPSDTTRSTPNTTTTVSDSKTGVSSGNPLRFTLVASPLPNPKTGNKETFSIAPDHLSVTTTSGVSCSVNEIVTRSIDDWRTATSSQQVNYIQSMFEDGNNTALIGTVSPNEVLSLDKQPLWLCYKRVVSSLLSVASSKYSFAEVSLSVTLVNGNELLADLLTGFDPSNPPQHSPKPLAVAFSPLFGPIVSKTTMIKPPTPLQLESTINSALYQVPALMELYPNKHPLIFASAVLKGVTDGDVYTNSLMAASSTDPQVFHDILDKKVSSPHELFEYALGGPCCTLFLGSINQGDANIDDVLKLVQRLQSTSNRSVRSCSVKRFIAFAENALRKSSEKLAAATSEKEKEAIERASKSMKIFYPEYKALLEDPENRDPRMFRKSNAS